MAEEKKLLTLMEFAKAHQGWPTLATLRIQAFRWRNDWPGYEGDHFIKTCGRVLVNTTKYWKWLENTPKIIKDEQNYAKIKEKIIKLTKEEKNNES